MKLSAHGLRRTYRSGEVTTEALRNIELTVQPGEFVSIVGSSGSGKTTLLNTLSGLDTRYEGSVKLGDQELCELSEPQLAQLRHRHVGFVFQEFNLLDHLTTTENVTLPGFFGPRGDDNPRERAAQLLERVGLGDRLRARPPRLSGGQKQRVAIARALFCRPSIVFCDEPTGSLDRDTGMSIMRLFNELNDSDDLTLVVVTHERHIADLARRRIVLEQGRIIEDCQQTPRWPDDDTDDDKQQDGDDAYDDAQSGAGHREVGT